MVAHASVKDNPRYQAACEYILKGWYVLPLEPNGKAPLAKLVPHGVQDSSNEHRVIWEWWASEEGADANVGIDLARSNLFGIGPDSDEWLTRFQEMGLPATAVAQTGGGEGHLHYYYQAPSEAPKTRINRSNEYDIQTQGYFVAPPSIHPSGRPYQWVLSPATYKDHRDIPWPPAWAITMLMEAVERREAGNAPAWGEEEEQNARKVRVGDLKREAQDWWNGLKFIPRADGTADRSSTLFHIALMLTQHHHTGPEIAQALADRDRALGYHKYSKRRGGGLKWYTDIARQVLTWTPNPIRDGPEAPPPLDDDGPRDYDPYLGPPRHDEHPTPKGRKGEWYMARGKFFARLEELGLDGEFSPSCTEVGKVAIITENPHLFLPKDVIADLIGRLYANKERLQARIKECGHKLGMDCEDHGERYRTTKTCKTDVHGACGTDTTNKLARLNGMDDMEGRRQYREVWMRSYIALEGYNVDAWADALQHQIDIWGKQIKKIAKRKRTEGRIVARACSFYMGRITRTHWKVMLREEYPGELDYIIEELCRTMEGDVIAENTYHMGESALLQLMEDSSIGLVGMDEEDPSLFYTYQQATKRRHLFQSMGKLSKDVKELPEAEKPRCDVEGCGKPLHPRPINEEDEADGAYNMGGYPEEAAPPRELVRQEALF